MGKKHPKKKTTEGSLSPDEQALLHALLEDVSLLTPSSVVDRLKTPQAAISFLERVPPDEKAAPAIVLGIREAFPQKAVQKAARKTLFRFKQRGIALPEKGEGDSPSLGVRPERPSEPSAYLSPPDGLGNRAVLLSIPKHPAGVDIGMGVVSDLKGLVEFVFGHYSKKRAKEIREVFFQNVQDLLETTLPHAAAVLEAAYSKGKAGLNPSAGDYLELRPWLLANVSLPGRPPVYERIPPESIPDADLTDSQVDKLLGHKWMETWITDPNALKPLVEEIMKVQRSPIIVSPEQKTARILDLKEEFLSRIYTDEMRAVFKARLEESAYLFHEAGEEDYAILALRAARSLEHRDSEFRTNDFLRHMLDHSLSHFLGSVEGEEKRAAEEKSPSGLILP